MSERVDRKLKDTVFRCEQGNSIVIYTDHKRNLDATTASIKICQNYLQQDCPEGCQIRKLLLTEVASKGTENIN